MKIKYIGRHTQGVDLAMPNGTYATVAHGAEVEVDAEHGESLLQQAENWVTAHVEKKSPAPKPEKADGA